MTIMRWEPFREMISLRQGMDRRFIESFIRPTATRPTRQMLAQFPGGIGQTETYQCQDKVGR